jgi:uncharacterized protein YcfL
MARWIALPLFLLACAACAGPQQQTCYRIVESVVTEAGARALMQVPCPPGQSVILADQS